MKRSVLATAVLIVATSPLAIAASHGMAQVAREDVKTGCGATPATGNGITDDSPAFVACMNAAATASADGTPLEVYVPAGVYLIKSTPLPTNTYGMSIRGDGSHKSYILVDPAYVGDVLAWSDAWSASALGGPTFNPTADKTGAAVQGLSIVGNTTSPNVQNAITFYDRDDFMYIRDVSVTDIHGACLRTGITKNAPQAYAREGTFFGLTCIGTGTATQPAVELSSYTTNVSDATNELHFFGLAIFAAAGAGLVVHNPNQYNATRLIDFYGLRVENSGADNIDIGASGDAGATNEIRIYGLQSISPGGVNSGFFGINIGLGSVQSWDVQIIGGQIGPCNATCGGLKIDNARLTSVKLGNVSTTGTNVTYTNRAGIDVTLDGGGLEASFTYSVPGTVTVPTWRTFTP